ncbi:MAG: hypothetical protein K8W52_10990 [Deltaproteobacteria bacterium]|nr:hypothetical protein [Deltaproteobacteria bacterium]
MERDTPEVLALLTEHMPDGDARLRHAWLYEQNPGGHALTWLGEDDATGALAGLTSFFPFRLWQGGAVVRGALGGDGYVRPAFRRRGLGAALHAASREAMIASGIECMYGAPGPMNVTPLKHGGSRQIAEVARWSRPLGRVGLHLPATGHALDRAVAALLRPRRDLGHLDPVGVDDRRVDDVWASTRPEIRLGAVRDAAFYAWRFGRAPAQRQAAFVVVRHERAIAVCALEPLGTDVRIVDLLAAPDAWRHALRAIAAHASDGGAETLDLKLLACDGHDRALWRNGFVERERKPYLVMVAPGAPAGSPFLDPARWFYTGADSDLDTLA